MRFWKEHVALRVSLIIMLVGLVLLIAALAIYNKPFQDERRR